MTPLATCPTCGAHLSLDHLRGTDCPYCRSAFPHHARAVEHAALVQRVFAQNIAAYATPPVPTYQVYAALPQIHLAMRRTQSAIAIAVAIAIAAAILGTLLCAALVT